MRCDPDAKNRSNASVTNRAAVRERLEEKFGENFPVRIRSIAASFQAERCPG